MATTFCSHNSALFNVRSILKANNGEVVGWSMLCLQRPTPCAPSLPVDTAPVDSPPVCSLTQEINGWLVAISKYMNSQSTCRCKSFQEVTMVNNNVHFSNIFV